LARAAYSSVQLRVAEAITNFYDEEALLGLCSLKFKDAAESVDSVHRNAFVRSAVAATRCSARDCVDTGVPLPLIRRCGYPGQRVPADRDGAAAKVFAGATTAGGDAPARGGRD